MRVLIAYKNYGHRNDKQQICTPRPPPICPALAPPRPPPPSTQPSPATPSPPPFHPKAKLRCLALNKLFANQKYVVCALFTGFRNDGGVSPDNRLASQPPGFRTALSVHSIPFHPMPRDAVSRSKTYDTSAMRGQDVSAERTQRTRRGGKEAQRRAGKGEREVYVWFARVLQWLQKGFTIDWVAGVGDRGR